MRLKDKFANLFSHANTEAELGELKDCAGAYDEVWVRDESGKLVRQEVTGDDVKEGQ